MVWDKDLPLGTKAASTYDDDQRANNAVLEGHSGVEHQDLTVLESAGGGRHNLPYGDETARDAIVAAGTATEGMQFWRNDTTPKRGERWNGSTWDIITNDTDVAASTNVLSWKEPVRFAATADVPAISGLISVDGTVVTAGDRIFLPLQTAGDENGIYIAAVGAWARAADMDTTSGVKGMTVVSVQEGTLYSDTLWKLTTNDPITVGTTATAWSLVNRLVFTSSNQTITDGTEVTIAHGLGAVPTKLQAHLICTTAEFGYSIDDIVLHGFYFNGPSSNNRGVTLVADATNCYLVYGADGVAIMRRSPGGQIGENTAITNGSWAAVVTAEL